MTAIKKTTTKPAKSPAPATKPASSAKPAATKKKAVAGAPVVAFPSPAPKVKPVATKPVATTVTAKIDVGYGNALYIRGEGPGLRWDQGTLMTCVGDNAWAISLGESARAKTAGARKTRPSSAAARRGKTPPPRARAARPCGAARSRRRVSPRNRD